MSLNTNAIITLSEAKLQLGLVDMSDDIKDPKLESMINEVSSYVELYCKKKFVSQSVSGELHDGDGTKCLYPRYFPLQQLSTETSPTDAQELASVQYRDDPDSSWTDIEDDIDHVFVDTGDDAHRSFIQLYDETFPRGQRNIKISYKAGYSTIPQDIKTVVLEMVQMRFNETKWGNDWLGRGSVNDSAGGRSESTNLLNLDRRWKMILDRYRVPSI